MKRKFLLLALIAGVSTVSWAAEKGASHFSSQYTDLTKDCKGAVDPNELMEGQDMPETCKGYGSYVASIAYSAWGAAVCIDGLEECLPEQSMVLKQRKLEWRLYDGQPFAVILRTQKYGEPADDGAGDPFVTTVGEVLTVRGLTGFEKAINFEIDVKKTKNPNQVAQQRADEVYLKVKKAAAK